MTKPIRIRQAWGEKNGYGADGFLGPSYHIWIHGKSIYGLRPVRPADIAITCMTYRTMRADLTIPND